MVGLKYITLDYFDRLRSIRIHISCSHYLPALSSSNVVPFYIAITKRFISVDGDGTTLPDVVPLHGNYKKVHKS